MGRIASSWSALLLAGLLSAPLPVAGHEEEPAQAEPAGEGRAGRHKEREEPVDRQVETSHRVTVGGRAVEYTARAGTIVLREEDGTPKAELFYIAYTRDGVTDPGERPLTFSFNGGPGSSSVWLHLGALGPRRVAMDEEGYPLPPPYRLVDNEHSLLDATDLVFIDPVTTGYSRAVPEEDPGQFHGLEEDLQWVGEFIRLYTTRARRWASPKFLIGESYGTTRAAGLARYLEDRHGMYFNGVMLVSSILNFQTARFDVGNDLPYVLFLPTYAATARFHGRLAPELRERPLEDFLREVERFAATDYTLALMAGDEFAAEEEARIAATLARYTGLSEEYIRRTNLRIDIHRFCKELLRDERQTVGRLDSRFKGLDRDAAGEEFEFDPSYAAIQGPYTATLNDYVRRELGFESDLPYEILTDRVRPWSYAEYQNRYVNVGEHLREAMARNQALRVFVANGYYDLATPYFATLYTFDHLGFDPGYEERVRMGFYEAGHMMYIQKASLERLREDLLGFLDWAVMGEPVPAAAP